MTLTQFTFINKTKYMAGKCALEQLPSELSQRQCKTALIVTDKKSVKKGAVKALVGAFGRCDTTLLVFDKTLDSVQASQVRDVAAIFRETSSDAIVAMGGKSAMDLARLVNIEVSLGIHDVSRIKNTRNESEKMKPLFVIPTCALTETCLSTPGDILDDAGRRPLNAFMPIAVLIDPRTMVPDSARETAAAGLAALLHAVEASIGPDSNPVSRSFAFAALTLLQEYGVMAVKKPSNTDIYLQMMSAVHLADAAFSNTTCGLGVSFIRALNRISGIDPDATAAVLLPALMKKRLKSHGEDVARLLWALEGSEEYAQTPASNRGQAAIDAVASLVTDLGKAGKIDTSLNASGIINGNMSEILKYVTEDGENLDADNIKPEEVKTMLAS